MNRGRRTCSQQGAPAGHVRVGKTASNVEFPAQRDPWLAQLGASAERYAIADPNAGLRLLRQFGENLAQHIASVHSLDADDDSRQADRLADIRRRQLLDTEVMGMLHMLRTHGIAGVHKAGRKLAIAEWPTDSGPVDQALCCGLVAVGVAEAKSFSTEVSSVIGQSERYSLVLQAGQADGLPAPSAWDKASQGSFPGWHALTATVTCASDDRLRFVFANNGRPCHRQFEGRSAVWFRDVRRASNHAAAPVGWPTPDGLLQLLALDVDASELQFRDAADYISA